eukprot:TRINITY_DN15536_c0_g1_i3.p1 TRINITY_DN15536_c0_g1~~TRINITY_DN15536_c0_g1_i3.p1  ORF type:complete len:279 (-),score=-58.41 TRINITY_DN15536_c0_g1_i3:143-979(-)
MCPNMTIFPSIKILSCQIILAHPIICCDYYYMMLLVYFCLSCYNYSLTLLNIYCIMNLCFLLIFAISQLGLAFELCDHRVFNWNFYLSHNKVLIRIGYHNAKAAARGNSRSAGAPSLPLTSVLRQLQRPSAVGLLLRAEVRARHQPLPQLRLPREAERLQHCGPLWDVDSIEWTHNFTCLCLSWRIHLKPGVQGQGCGGELVRQRTAAAVCLQRLVGGKQQSDRRRKCEGRHFGPQHIQNTRSQSYRLFHRHYESACLLARRSFQLQSLQKCCYQCKQ